MIEETSNVIADIPVDQLHIGDLCRSRLTNRTGKIIDIRDDRPREDDIVIEISWNQIGDGMGKNAAYVSPYWHFDLANVEIIR